MTAQDHNKTLGIVYYLSSAGLIIGFIKAMLRKYPQDVLDLEIIRVALVLAVLLLLIPYGLFRKDVGPEPTCSFSPVCLSSSFRLALSWQLTPGGSCAVQEPDSYLTFSSPASALDIDLVTRSHNNMIAWLTPLMSAPRNRE